MNKMTLLKNGIGIVVVACCAVVVFRSQPATAELMQSVRSGGQLQMSFLYLLSGFSGPIPSQWARVDYDQKNNEIYTLNPATNEVQVFNQQGMNIFSLGGGRDPLPDRHRRRERWSELWSSQNF